MSVPYYDYIAYNAQRYAGKCALHDLASNTRLTYAALDKRVSRLARRMRDVGRIRRGDRVAILAHNSAAYLEVFFACGRIGAIMLPLNWRLTVPELGMILHDGEPSLLIHDTHFAAQAADLLDRSPNIAACWSLGPENADLREDLASGPLLDRAERLDLEDIAVIMYTSGTTGRPKGALLTFAMSFWNAINLGIPGSITPDSVALSVMPMFHTAGLNVYAIPTLHAGGTVLIMRGFSAEEVLATIDDAALGVTHFFGVPTAWQFLAQHERFDRTDFSRIVLAGVGGASVPLPLLELWRERGIILQNGLGMTETGPSTTTLAPEDAIRKVGSIGKPLLHVELKVARADGSETDCGEPGEIWVRGPSVTPGYWRNPVETAKSFTDGWLRTGDIVVRDEEGFLFLLDRAKDMYISGGENVYPAEVESVLLGIEGVTAAAVIGTPDEKWGETGLAIITLRHEATVTPEDVMAHCQQNLARFKHPREVIIVDALPLTASGKVHKPTLRDRYGTS